MSRCEKIRDTLESCLSQIQNMVPLLLAGKVGLASFYEHLCLVALPNGFKD